MTNNIKEVFSTMTVKQKAMAGVLAVVVVIVIWQGMGMFGGGGSSPSIQPVAKNNNMMNANMPNNMAQQQRPVMPSQPSAPQSAQLLRQSPEMTQREQELTKLQQETQARYLAALNELSNLKMSVQLAETTSALMKAKFETLSTQKSIVDLLTKPSPQVNTGTYPRGLINPIQPGSSPSSAVSVSPASMEQSEENYTVISVSQLQYKWAAVIGLNGNFYSVMAGDVLPADGSVVISINKSGIILEKNGTQRKVSLVPII